MNFMTKIKAAKMMFCALIIGPVTKRRRLAPEEEKAMGRFVFGKKTWEKMHSDLKSNEQYAMIQPEEAEITLAEHLEKEPSSIMLDDEHDI